MATSDLLFSKRYMVLIHAHEVRAVAHCTSFSRVSLQSSGDVTNKG